MNFRRDAIETISARGGVLAANIVTSMLVARALGPEDRGVLAYVLLVPGTLYTILNLGIASSITYFTGQFRIRLGRIFARTLLVTGIAAIAGAAISSVMLLREPGEAARHAGAAALYCVLLFIFAATDPVITALKEFRLVNLLAFITGLVTLAVVLYLWHSGRLTIGAYLWLLIVTTGTSALLKSLWIARRGLPMHARRIDAASDHPLEWSELFRFSLGMYANNVIWLLILKVDQFIVRGFAGDYALGLYAVAAGLAESFRNLPSLVGTVVFPYVVEMKESERKPFLSRVAAQTLWIALVIAVVIAAAAGPLVTTLYGEEYAGAATSAALLFIAIALLSTGDLLGYHFIAAGRPTVITAVSAMSLVLNVALNFALIPYWGIAGAAAASVAAYGGVSLAVAWLLRRREDYKIRDMLWPLD